MNANHSESNKSIKSLVAFSLSILLNIFSYSQVPCRTILPTDYEDKNRCLLEEEFGSNKIICKDYNTQILIALSYFPELKNVKINFIYSNISTTMQCRPDFYSVFKSKSNRQYNIYINNNPNFKGVLLKDIPFNAQIGIIGHELSHIIDYESRSSLGIVKRGLDYCSQNTKRKFEYNIDSIAIEKGLGWQLYDWSQFAVSNTISSEKYKAFKRKIYLQASNIEEKIKAKYLYNHTLAVQE